jgi:phage shock protein C
MNDRLYRSRDERMIAGVAGGLAMQFHLDPSLVRILWVILVIPTGGLALLLYVAMAFVVPEEPAGDSRWAQWDRGTAGNPTAAAATGAATAAGTAGDASAAGGPGSGAGAPPVGAPALAGSTPVAMLPAAAPTASGAGQAPSWQDQRQAWRDERRAARHGNGDGQAALLVGVILVLIGIYFLARTYLPALALDVSWPILLVAVGVLLLLGSVRRSPRSPG